MEAIEPFEHDSLNSHQTHFVNVSIPFTSLCGYLTDVKSAGVFRKPLDHSLFSLTLSWHALYKAPTHTSSPSNLHIPSPTDTPQPCH